MSGQSDTLYVRPVCNLRDEASFPSAPTACIGGGMAVVVAVLAPVAVSTPHGRPQAHGGGGGRGQVPGEGGEETPAEQTGEKKVVS